MDTSIKRMLAIVLVLFLFPKCAIAFIDEDVLFEGEKIGELFVDTTFNFLLDEGIFAEFLVTKENQSNEVLTLTELNTVLNQDHFNWFQVILTDTNPLQDSSGTLLVPPYIDPPNGGYLNSPDDTRPWYWSEVPVGSFPADLGFATSEFALDFQDFPRDNPGNAFEFATFLIGDFGDTTYRVFNGFTWSVSIDALGFANVDALNNGAVFTDQYADIISNEFGWSEASAAVPEPSMILLFSGGLIWLLRKKKSA